MLGTIYRGTLSVVARRGSRWCALAKGKHRTHEPPEKPHIRRPTWHAVRAGRYDFKHAPPCLLAPVKRLPCVEYSRHECEFKPRKCKQGVAAVDSITRTPPTRKRYSTGTHCRYLDYPPLCNPTRKINYAQRHDNNSRYAPPKRLRRRCPAKVQHRPKGQVQIRLCPRRCYTSIISAIDALASPRTSVVDREDAELVKRTCVGRREYLQSMEKTLETVGCVE